MARMIRSLVYAGLGPYSREQGFTDHQLGFIYLKRSSANRGWNAKRGNIPLYS
jgi:hypothetical protein